MQKKYSRRRFLKRSSDMSLAASAAFSIGLPGMFTARSALAAPDDYKALVYIFLSGGNDSFNMLAPRGNGSLRTRYETSRASVAHPQDQLHALTTRAAPKIYGGESYNAFGVHPNCGEIAELFNAQDLSFICNIGNLVAPTTKEQYLNRSVARPPQLFAHDGQQRQFQSEPTALLSYGWGGRLAEYLKSNNTDANLSSLISVSGLNTFQVSQDADVNTFVMNRDGPTNLARYRGDRKLMMDEIMSDEPEHLMARKYRNIFLSAQTASERVGESLNLAGQSGVDYDAIFTDAGAGNTNLGRQLKTVARMIAGGGASVNRRPIFFVTIGGFDTHQNILSDHASRMIELSTGLKAFSDALKAQSDFSKVLTFAGSEFGRTFTPNGDDSGAGTDHAWGGHALVMGDMVQGGRLFGTHPDLIVGGDLDVDTRNPRGRWIPTNSTSQCSAIIANWMGLNRNLMSDVFPSLSNFPDPFSASENMNFISAGGNV